MVILNNSNLLVDDLGNVKLADFGFIKLIYSEYLTSQEYKKPNENGIISISSEKQNKYSNIKPYLNSYYYSPPEILLNQWLVEDKSRDVWSIGWSLWEMLAGK